MSKYLWFQIVGNKDNPCHMVLDTDQTKTLCNELDLTRSDLRVYDELGPRRPCDNCTEIAARHEDAGDQPPV